jgi:hypothetical protein
VFDLDFRVVFRALRSEGGCRAEDEGYTPSDSAKDVILKGVKVPVFSAPSVRAIIYLTQQGVEAMIAFAGVFCDTR